MPQASITKICLKSTCLKFRSDFPGANELTTTAFCQNVDRLVYSIPWFVHMVCDSIWRVPRGFMGYIFPYYSGLLHWRWDWLDASKVMRGLWAKGSVQLHDNMMTSSNGNIFQVTGHLWGESTGDRWIPLTMASVVKLWCSLCCARTNGWAKRLDAGDLRHHAVNYDATVMKQHIKKR